MEEAYCLGYIVTGEWRGASAGAFHVWLDRECSKNKEFKQFVEFMARQDAKFKKEMRKLNRDFEKTRKKRKSKHRPAKIHG